MASRGARGRRDSNEDLEVERPGRNLRRGEIWWASIPDPAGSAPGFRRPVLVVQSDEFNASRIDTILAVAITSNTRLAEAPGNVLLPARASNLPKASVANVSQVITLDRRFLAERIGRIDTRTLEQVESGLRLVLAL